MRIYRPKQYPFFATEVSQRQAIAMYIKLLLFRFPKKCTHLHKSAYPFHYLRHLVKCEEVLGFRMVTGRTKE
eukprot:6050576-Amphidinium_carterae.2